MGGHVDDGRLQPARPLDQRFPGIDGLLKRRIGQAFTGVELCLERFRGIHAKGAGCLAQLFLGNFRRPAGLIDPALKVGEIGVLEGRHLAGRRPARSRRQQSQRPREDPSDHGLWSFCLVSRLALGDGQSRQSLNL